MATIEFFFLGKRLSIVKVGRLVLMTVGVCMACASDMKFSWLGAVLAATGTACTSIEAVLYSHLQQSLGWDTLQLPYKTMSLPIVGMTIVAMYSDLKLGAAGEGAGSGKDLYGAGDSTFNWHGRGWQWHRLVR